MSCLCAAAQEILPGQWRTEAADRTRLPGDDAVAGERNFADSITAESNMDAAIPISVDEQNRPGGLIVKEFVPLDASARDVSSCDPPYNGFDPPAGKIKRVFVAADVSDRTLTYAASVRDNALVTYASSGCFHCLLGGAETEAAIAGDNEVGVTADAPSLTCSISTDPDPASGDAPLEVHFLGSASGGTPPYSYWWDFGDSTGSLQQNPTHAYDAGAYAVVLTVSDGDGRASETAQVEVSLLPVTAERELPDVYQAGSAVDVTISVEVDENNKPNGLIVKEYVPTSPPFWDLTSCDPGYNNFDKSTGEIKWVFMGGGVKDFTITYTASVPAEATGPKTFRGELRYIVESTEMLEPIRGDSSTSSDADEDGMADDWEGLHGLGSTVNDAEENPDADAYVNYQEYVADTDPQEASSFPRIREIWLTFDNQAVVGWDSVIGRAYIVWQSDDLRAWMRAGDTIVAQDPETFWIGASVEGSSQKFYRIQVQK